MESTHRNSKKCGLTVMLAKAVTCTKVEDDVKHEFISVGAAIWGSSNHKHYEVVLYKSPKDDYISRILISQDFQFKIKNENTAEVFCGDKMNWELKFTNSCDLKEFAIHVGLARWIVSDMRCPLKQELRIMHLPTDEDIKQPVSETGDYIEIYYVAKVISKDHQFGSEVANNIDDGRPLGLKIGAEWDKGLVGATPGSERLIIIPHHALGIWKCLVPNFQHLSLLVKIQRFGKSESDFNIWNPIGNLGLSIPTQGIHSRACRPGLITQLFKNGQTPPMRGAITRQLAHCSQPFGVEQNLSIHPYKLLQFSTSVETIENMTVALFETLTQMKVSNSKVKELCTQLQIRNPSVRAKIESALRSNLKLIHELEENFMEMNEQRHVDEFFMRHPDALEDTEQKLGDEAELNSFELTHPFEITQPEVKIFTCEGFLPDISQLSQPDDEDH